MPGRRHSLWVASAVKVELVEGLRRLEPARREVHRRDRALSSCACPSLLTGSLPEGSDLLAQGEERLEVLLIGLLVARQACSQPRSLVEEGRSVGYDVVEACQRGRSSSQSRSAPLPEHGETEPLEVPRGAAEVLP